MCGGVGMGGAFGPAKTCCFQIIYDLEVDVLFLLCFVLFSFLSVWKAHYHEFDLR